MDAKFSPRVRDIMSYSHSEALRLGNAYIGLEHLFLGMLKEGGSCAIQILTNLNLNIEIFQKKLEASIKIVNPTKPANENLPLTKQAERVLKYSYIIAKEFRSELVRSEHLMLAILHEKNNIISQNLEFEGINHDNFKAELIKYNAEMGKDLPQQPMQPESPSDIFESDDDDEEDPMMPPPEKPGWIPSWAARTNWSASPRSSAAERRTTPSSSVSQA